MVCRIRIKPTWSKFDHKILFYILLFVWRYRFLKCFLLIVYVLGSYYTFKGITHNIFRYTDYNSIFTQKEDDTGQERSFSKKLFWFISQMILNFVIVSTFPKISVCSYQMHSLQKLHEKYPEESAYIKLKLSRSSITIAKNLTQKKSKLGLII